MYPRCLLWTAMVAIVLASAIAGAGAADETKYPDWKGQWNRIGGGGQFDPTKPPGRGQQPPLTPEYQAIWDTPQGTSRRRAGLQHAGALSSRRHAANDDGV
jgi:hypothetical protein